MYEIIFTKSSSRQYNKLDKKYQSSLKKAIERISKEPKIGKPLSGEFKGLWRIRFSKYRIVYRIFERRLIIVVVSVKHRKDIYR